ncbi:hypothetical protein ABZ467_23010 [Streptomyces sp. NPDC005727]|uniref:hypothetical protein n=1 Tax=Streptomyces sp. NPDC005727 TaxID=3157053 RepID=UPI0033DE5194
MTSRNGDAVLMSADDFRGRSGRAPKISWRHPRSPGATPPRRRSVGASGPGVGACWGTVWKSPVWRRSHALVPLPVTQMCGWRS